jgi:hypothetical protein
MIGVVSHLGQDCVGVGEPVGNPDAFEAGQPAVVVADDLGCDCGGEFASVLLSEDVEGGGRADVEVGGVEAAVLGVVQLV